MSWSHHAEVAPLSPAEQAQWLELALANGWSVRQLREEIHGLPAAPPMPEPPPLPLPEVEPDRQQTIAWDEQGDPDDVPFDHVTRRAVPAAERTPLDDYEQQDEEWPVGWPAESSAAYVHNPAKFRHVIQQWQFASGDLVYADPPYDRTFGSYVAAHWVAADFDGLLAWLDRHDGPVVLSNLATDRVREVVIRYGCAFDALEGPRRVQAQNGQMTQLKIIATRGVEPLRWLG